MNDNKNQDKYYRVNILRRGWDGAIAFLKSLPQNKANAVYIAVAFFVILIAFMEYKVFESTYTLTGNLVLSASVLGVTAFGGVIAEVFLHRNNKATDDQLLAANDLFIISLIASAIAGFGIWAQSSGTETVSLGKWSLDLPDFANFVFAMITVVTVLDILLLRWYIREDVDLKHSRNVERVESRRRTAELETDESLIEFDAEVERKAKKYLKVEKKRKDVKDELQRLYGGHVPQEVLDKAMLALDEIQKADETADDDQDGTDNKHDTTYSKPGVKGRPNQLQVGQAFAQQTGRAELEDKGNGQTDFTKAGR